MIFRVVLHPITLFPFAQLVSFWALFLFIILDKEFDFRLNQS